MTPEMEQLYRAALTADQAWSEALTRQFGAARATLAMTTVAYRRRS